MSSKSPPARSAIGPDDVVSLRGNHLVKSDGTRFLMKGIGFPVPQLDRNDKLTFNATAWNGILHQLVEELDVEINTVRVYRMDPETDYAPFFEEAARLGIYVIVPLTGAAGDGVLDRNKVAPKCYARHLYRYGVKCLENYLKYPNALAGLVGNEVMNSLDTWPAAPCVKAYARDLKGYMEAKSDESGRRSLPLMYAAQNSGVGPSLDDVSTMRLTMDYLTCVPGSAQAQLSSSQGELSQMQISPIQGAISSSQGVLSRMAASISAAITREEASDTASIDIFGINVESWCSSQATFERNEDGSEGSYHSLWRGLQNSTIPLVFSEMGCSHLHFDMDNGQQDDGGPRDWAQVPVVLNEMSDVFSGFCAYAYDGNPQFDMFKGGPWRDEPLVPTDDLFNFRDQLKMVAENRTEASSSSGSMQQVLPICGTVEAELSSRLDIKLYGVDKMRTYSSGAHFAPFWTFAAAMIAAAAVTAFVTMRRARRSRKKMELEQQLSSQDEEKLLEAPGQGLTSTYQVTNYQSIGAPPQA